MTKKDDRKQFIIGIILSVLLIAGGFAVYGLVRLGAISLLLSVGIEQEVYQYLLIIIIVVTAFSLTGVGFRKSLKRLLG